MSELLHDTPVMAAKPTRLLPSMPKLSLFTSFFSTPPPSATSTDLDNAALSKKSNDTTRGAAWSPTDSADPQVLHFERQDSAGGESDMTKAKKKVSRAKTTFSICHPAPKHSSVHKIHVRSKPLLQLHRVEANARPMPAFDVLASSFFSARLVRAVNRVYDAQQTLCPTDLAIVRAEQYHTEADDDTVVDILAMLCGMGRRDVSEPSCKVRMVMADGTVWHGTRLTNGTYEINTVDDHGLERCARWVKKRQTKPTDSTTQLDATVVDEGKRFKFSTISPSSRRHPVIATLSGTSVDIYKSYTQPSPTDVPSPDLADDVMFPSPINDVVETSAELHDIITASAVWVALCEQSPPKDNGLARSPSARTMMRSQSYASPPPSPTRRPTSGAEAETPSNRKSSFRQTFQRAPSLLRRQLGGSPSKDSVKDHSTVASSAGTPSASVTALDQVDGSGARRRARADTTCTVLVHENAGQWQPDSIDMHEAECEDEDLSEHKTAAMIDSPLQPHVDEKRGDVSRSTSGSDDTIEREKNAIKIAPATSKKRRGFLRVLMCAPSR